MGSEGVLSHPARDVCSEICSGDCCRHCHGLGLLFAYRLADGRVAELCHRAARTAGAELVDEDDDEDDD
jgi:hypothetical protein